jgi:hypothetical protein
LRGPAELFGIVADGVVVNTGDMFTINSSGFVAGLNRLEFVLNHDGGPGFQPGSNPTGL